MDSIPQQPAAAVKMEGYYQHTIAEQTKQIYELYKRVEQLAKEKGELRREIERLSKFDKFE
jgi:predicted RNase H-like nuclease (RuvC/YqgF family)